MIVVPFLESIYSNKRRSITPFSYFSIYISLLKLYFLLYIRTLYINILSKKNLCRTPLINKKKCKKQKKKRDVGNMKHARGPQNQSEIALTTQNRRIGVTHPHTSPYVFFFPSFPFYFYY